MPLNFPAPASSRLLLPSSETHLPTLEKCDKEPVVYSHAEQESIMAGFESHTVQRVREGQGMKDSLMRMVDSAQTLYASLVAATGPGPEVSAAFIRNLPKDIQTLIRLAGKAGPRLPDLFERWTAAQGLGKLTMPCQTGEAFLTRVATLAQAQKKLDRLSTGMRSQPIVESGAHASRLLVRGYAYVMLAVCLSNVHEIAKLMLNHQTGEEVHTLMLLGRQAAAIAIHLQIARHARVDADALAAISKNDGLDLPPFEMRDLPESFNDRLAMLKARNAALRCLVTQELPQLFISSLFLSLVNATMSDCMWKNQS